LTGAAASIGGGSQRWPRSTITNGSVRHADSESPSVFCCVFLFVYVCWWVLLVVVGVHLRRVVLWMNRIPPNKAARRKKRKQRQTAKKQKKPRAPASENSRQR
jgi:hypothetical protein